MVNVLIWANDCLDGAASALAIHGLFSKGDTVTVKNANHGEFPGLYKGWYMTSFSEYDKVFILNFHIPDDMVHLVDHNNIIIINNEESSLNITQAKSICKDSSSCIKLIQESITKVFYNELYDLVDDYRSGVLNNQDSLKLNAVYYSLNQPRVEKFISRFMGGINGFNAHEKNAIKLYFNRYKEVVTEANFFTGLIKDNKVISCFADYAYTDVMRYAIKKYRADIAIVINMEARLVFFHKNSDTCSISMNKLASKMCNGSGCSIEASGTITREFLEFTKQLVECK